VSALPAGAGPSPAGRGAAGVDDGLMHEVRVGRQAVYDSAYRLVSYELLFRRAGRDGRAAADGRDSDGRDGVDDGDGVDGRDDPPDATSGETATSQVMAATFATFGLRAVSDGKPVFINFTRGFLTGMLPIPVEPDNVIIEVTEQVSVDHELLLGLAQLKQAGYRIAVDNYRGDLGRSALVELADFVKIDVNALSAMVVPGLVQSCQLTGATLVAVNVRDAETLHRCAALGFELFQGDHLYRPAVLHRRVLSPSQLICARLLNELSDPDVPVARVERLVGSDPGLAIRLLRSAHSASGAGRAVESLRQALVLIGPQRLRSWVVLTLLEGVATQNASDELWNVLARAHCCQRLAERSSERDTDRAYTVGLLAGAARLLGTDASTVADVSGIGDEARAALVAGEGPSGRALRAVLAHEAADDEGVVAAGYQPGEVSRIYMESLQESLVTVHQLLGR
jgi:c-di-GMP-related signal transduction protein